MDIADILFLAADPREFSGALRFWQNVRPIGLPVHWARSATRKGRPIVAVANGAGWDRARLGSEVVPSGQLCNIGYCGALDGSLRIADIVVSSRHLPVRCERKHVLGLVASSEHVVRTAEDREQLRAQGNIAVEMESAGIRRQPFYCIKAVSDLAGETFANDFEKAYSSDGQLSKARVVFGALGNPLRRVPELIRLARRTATASERLGEFLDACEF